MADMTLRRAAIRAQLAGTAFLDEISDEEFVTAKWLDDFLDHIKRHILNEHIDVDFALKQGWVSLEDFDA